MVLHNRYGIKHAHLADIMQCDRATIYHSVRTAKEQVKLAEGYYVMAVQRWASILEEFEAEMKTIDSVIKEQTTEEMIYTLLMKYDEDIEAVKVMIGNKDHPASKSLWWKRLGILHRKNGDYGQAKDAFVKAIELDPHSAVATNALAVCYLEEGEIVSGLHWLNETIRHSPCRGADRVGRQRPVASAGGFRRSGGRCCEGLRW